MSLAIKLKMLLSGLPILHLSIKITMAGLIESGLMSHQICYLLDLTLVACLGFSLLWKRQKAQQDLVIKRCFLSFFFLTSFIICTGCLFSIFLWTRKSIITASEHQTQARYSIKSFTVLCITCHFQNVSDFVLFFMTGHMVFIVLHIHFNVIYCTDVQVAYFAVCLHNYITSFWGK